MFRTCNFQDVADDRRRRPASLSAADIVTDARPRNAEENP